MFWWIPQTCNVHLLADNKCWFIKNAKKLEHYNTIFMSRFVFAYSSIFACLCLSCTKLSKQIWLILTAHYLRNGVGVVKELNLSLTQFSWGEAGTELENITFKGMHCKFFNWLYTEFYMAKNNLWKRLCFVWVLNEILTAILVYLFWLILNFHDLSWLALT